MPALLEEKKVRAGMQFREMQVDAQAIDKEKRTARFSFSSEALIRTVDWTDLLGWAEFYEVLGHEKGEADLSRLNNGGAVRDGHWGDQVGKTFDATLEEKRGLTSVLYSRNQRATEILNDVVDGIRQNVSVGYRVLEYRHEGYRDGIPVLRAVRWEAIHVAHVPDPADATVGVGRSKGEEKQHDVVVKLLKERAMSDQIVAPPAPVAQVDVKVVTREALERERKRIGEIRAIADAEDKKSHNPKIREEEKRAIESGMEHGDFGLRVLALQGEIQPLSAIPPTHLDMPKTDVRKYSILKALRGEDGLERECHQALLKRGIEPKKGGILIPWDVQSRQVQQVAVGADGGFLVNTQNAGFIDLLRPNPVCRQAGMQVISGLRDNISMVRQTASTTAFWIGENVTTTASVLQLGNLVMSPHTISACTRMTRQLMMQSDPSIEMLVANDIRMVLEAAVDRAVLHGTGGVQPIGIAATAGINTPTAAAFVYASAIAWETAIEAANAMSVGLPVWVTTPAVKGTLKARPKAVATANYIINGVAVPGTADRPLQSFDEMNGYRVFPSTQVVANGVFFGVFSTVVLGEWGVLELKYVDQGANYRAGEGEILAFYDVDTAVRQPAAFDYNNNFS